MIVYEIKNWCFLIVPGAHLLSVPPLRAISVHRSGGYPRAPYRSPLVHNIGTLDAKWKMFQVTGSDATTGCPEWPELPPPFILLLLANVSQPPPVKTGKPENWKVKCMKNHRSLLWLSLAPVYIPVTAASIRLINPPLSSAGANISRQRPKKSVGP